MDQLLSSGTSPNALDAGQATEAAQLIEATLDEDEEDDAELLTDEEEDEAVQEAGAAERERKRRRWCARRLGTRLELAAACQSALRWGEGGGGRDVGQRQGCEMMPICGFVVGMGASGQGLHHACHLDSGFTLASNPLSPQQTAQPPPSRQSVKLHDPLLTRRLLAAGAAPGGGPGQALMEELLDEWGLLSHMVSLQQVGGGGGGGSGVRRASAACRGWVGQQAAARRFYLGGCAANDASRHVIATVQRPASHPSVSLPLTLEHFPSHPHADHTPAGGAPPRAVLAV